MAEQIQHPHVANSTMTCIACPEQYEGKLTDGRWFYFRFRHGYASLAVGWDYDAVMGGEDAGMEVGQGQDGCFDDEDQRDQVFAELLSRLTGPEHLCGHCRGPLRGYAFLGRVKLCHPDTGMDCYKLVTLHGHGAPCLVQPCYDPGAADQASSVNETYYSGGGTT